MCAGGHPVRHCHHRQSSASPLASDAERPQLARPPSLLLRLSASLISPQSRSHHASISPISQISSPLCVHAPRVRPRACARARALVAAPLAIRQRLAHHGVFGPRLEPYESWETSGDLGDLAPQPAASRPLKRSLSSRLLRDSWRVGTVPIPLQLCACVCACVPLWPLAPVVSRSV